MKWILFALLMCSTAFGQKNERSYLFAKWFGNGPIAQIAATNSFGMPLDSSGYVLFNQALTGGVTAYLDSRGLNRDANGYVLVDCATGCGAGSVSSIATTAPITGGTITGTGTIACATCTVTVASGTSALGTSAISSAACATVVTTAGTGIATTDVITAGFNGDPTAVTGYAPATTGMLTIIAYPSSGNVNFKVCNNTSASITPGAITLNWRVVR